MVGGRFGPAHGRHPQRPVTIGGAASMPITFDTNGS